MVETPAMAGRGHVTDAQAMVAVDTDRDGARRTDRQVGWLISLGGGVLVLGQAPLLLPHLSAHLNWWILGCSLIAVLVLCLAVLGRRLPFEVLRAGWIAVPVLGWFLWATVFLSFGAEEAEAVMVWPWTLQPVVVSYLVLWARPIPAVALTIVPTLLPALSALVFLGTVPPPVASMTPILGSTIAYLAIFFGIKIRLGRLRQAESHAREQHRLSQIAAVEAQRQERLRRLIHDEVLSVLTAAMSFHGAPPAQLRAEARHALLLLDTTVPAAADVSQRVTAEEAMDALTAALRRIDPQCPLHARIAGGPVPATALAAVADAAGEALRNSVRHAGRDCPRTVDLQIGGDGIRVIVRDQGRGFELEAVDPARFGIRESILARMQALDGGAARVRTAPGRGTEVELTWRSGEQDP